MEKSKKGGVSKKAIVAGATLAAVAAAVAGTYFLYGSKNAAKNRKKVKAWSLIAKGEILEKLEKLGDVNEAVYHKIVDEVSKKYESLKKIDKKEITEFATELKKHWKGIASDIKKSVKK